MIREIDINDFDDINIIGSKIKNNFNEYYNIKNNLNKDYVSIYVYEEERVKGFIYLENHIDTIDLIAIAVSEFNKGIGSKLLEYAILNNKGKNIILEVRENNINAIKLYEKFNFKEISRRKKYYDGEDAIIMEVIC